MMNSKLLDEEIRFREAIQTLKIKAKHCSSYVNEESFWELLTAMIELVCLILVECTFIIIHTV